VPREQRFVFDEVAELYERVRPGYPAALVDDLVELAGLGPESRLLELGCGTGQATVALAERGYRMVCLEPGPALRARALARLARFPGVEVRPETFEAWPLEAKAFDLVFAAQSFHWIDPAQRFAKSARALRPGGALAVFGNAPRRDDAPARRALERVYAQRAPTLVDRAHFTGPGSPPDTTAEAFRQARELEDPVRRTYVWERDYDADTYVGLCETQSDHRLLPERERAFLLEGVREAIEAHGGRLRIPYEAQLLVARRRPEI